MWKSETDPMIDIWVTNPFSSSCWNDYQAYNMSSSWLPTGVGGGRVWNSQKQVSMDSYWPLSEALFVNIVNHLELNF